MKIERLRLLAPLLGLALTFGCSSTPSPDVYAGMPGSVFAPQPPPFLRGSMGMLLTNAEGFTARVTLEPPPLREQPEEVRGQLMGQGGKLVFAPDPPKKKRKHHIEPGLFFVWDVARGNGFVLSEALQGYAPISSTLRFTNVVAQPGTAAPRRVGGYSSRQERVTVAANDGVSSAYEVWRAADLNGLPVQIVSQSAGRREVVSLSRIRLGLPPKDVFAPPGGFTRYENVEVMMTELTLREESLKGNPVGGWERKGAGESQAPAR